MLGGPFDAHTINPKVYAGGEEDKCKVWQGNTDRDGKQGKEEQSRVRQGKGKHDMVGEEIGQ